MSRNHPRLTPQVMAYATSGASGLKKSMVAWRVSDADGDTDVTRHLPVLRARCRDLAMSCPIAAGAIAITVANTVGSGLVLNASPDHAALGISAAAAAAWKAHVEREFALWSRTCDASRTYNFFQLQSMALQSALLSGDCFAALPMVRRTHDPYATRVYIMEADRICDPAGITGPMPDIMEGVEVGAYGEPVAYHIARYHPGGSAWHRGMQTWHRVPAFGHLTGRRNILHIMSGIGRPGQRRGTPLLAPVIEELKQLGRYTEAELDAAVVAGMFTGYVRTSGADGLAAPFDDAVQDRDPNSLTMGPGTINYLDADEDITFAQPGRPNANYADFVDALVQQIGSAIGIPREFLLYHFDSSYSSSKAAQNEAQKIFRTRRQWLIDDFIQPVYEEWLREAVAIGRVPAPGFDDPARAAAWSRADWTGDAPGSLDPLKEVNAAILRIQHGLSTHAIEAMAFTGTDFIANAEQLERERSVLPNAPAMAGTSDTTIEED